MGCAQLAVIAIRACLAALLRLSAELYGRSVQPEIGVTQYGCGKPRLLLAAAIIFCMAVAISMSLVVKLLTSDTLSTKRSADAVTLEPISLQLQRLGVSFVCIIVTVVLLYRLRCSHPKKASKRQLVQQQPGTVHTTEIPAEPLVSSENQTSAEQAVKQEDTQYLEPAKHHSSHSTKVINSRSLGLDPAALSALAEQLVAKQHPTTAGKLNGLLIRSSILHQQQQLQQGLGKRCSALYRSPVAHQSVSIKINRPPSTDPAVMEKFNSQLAAAVQAAVMAAVRSPTLAAADFTNSSPVPLLRQQQQQQQYIPLITDVTAFPGCHQVVMHLVLPRELMQQQQHQLLLWQQQLLQQHVDTEVSQVLAGWSGLELLSTTLLPLQQQQQQQEADKHSESDVGIAAAGAPPAAAAEVAASMVMPTFGGIHLQPLVLGLAGDVASSSNSSTGGGSNTPAAAGHAAEVHLCLPAAAVQQLQAAGNDAVRVVVAAVTPAAAVSAQIPTSLLLLDEVYQLLPSAAAAAGTSAVEGILVDPVTLRIPLPLQQQQQQWQVLTVLCLPAGDPQSSSDQLAAAAAAAGSETSMIGSIPRHAVIVKLPLLLLPAGAAAELQELSKDPSLDHDRDLLPLLLDLAAVLGACSTTGSSSSSGSGGSQHHGAIQTMATSLLSCFTENSLQECMQLLEGLEESGSSSMGAGHEPTAAVAARQSAVPWVIEESSAPAERTDSSSSGSSSRSLPLKPHRSHDSEHQQQGISSSSSINSSSILGYDASELRALPPNALRVSAKMILFGFRPAAAEAAYQYYKGVALLRQDFYNMVLHAIGACFVILRLLTMLFSSTATTNEIITHILRGQFVVFHTLFCSICWAASAYPNSRLGFVRQYRGLVLLGGMLLVLLVTVTEYQSNGVIGTATRAVFEQHKDSPEFLLTFRHVLQPILARANMWPMTVVYLVAQIFVFDSVFGYLTAFGLSAMGTAGLMVGVHLSIAVMLEYNMRRSFVRCVRAST